jgi:HK97 family phage major capsid protein
MQVQRAILSTGNSGALVGTTHRDDMYIEALRAESIVMGMGAVMLTDLVGNVDIPKAMGGMSFSFIAEDDDSPDTDASFESVTLTPRTVSGSIAITRKLTKQSSPEIERLIESDMRAGMALMIDKAVLAGDGTGANPTGILHTTGVNTVAIADADGKPTFAETVAFETALAEDNALRGTLNYVTTPAINGHWKTAPIDAGSGVMINKNNIVNGYKSTGTTLMPTGKTIFGNFSDVIIGTWGILDLVLDTATRAAKGGIVLRAWHEIDVAIRHPQSFAISA